MENVGRKVWVEIFLDIFGKNFCLTFLLEFFCGQLLVGNFGGILLVENATFYRLETTCFSKI